MLAGSAELFGEIAGLGDGGGVDDGRARVLPRGWTSGSNVEDR